MNTEKSKKNEFNKFFMNLLKILILKIQTKKLHWLI